MAQANDLFDIYDFYEPAWWQNPWIWGTGIALLTIAAGLAAWHFWRKKRIISPWDAALTQLTAIDTDQFSRQEEFKRFYFTLTHVAKTYVDARYGWQVSAKTDEELLTWLEQEHPEHPCTSTVRAMTENLLLIKFANMDALKSQAAHDKQAVIDLINRTKPTS